MLSKTLKRFGNSRCLPLDKTLLAILGVEYENDQVSISVEGNKLIIEKMSIYEEKTQFLLNEQQWEIFNKMLDEKPNVKAIQGLLNSKGVLDE
jgi:antitoxin component of MazEF toxin-antitoxin module